MAKSQGKNKRNKRAALRMERLLARSARPPQVVGVSFKEVTRLDILPGRVLIEGIDINGNRTVETQVIPNTNPPTKYYLITGDSH
jgi:GTPase